MTALDQVTDMKSQGYSDQDISTSLQDQGISPKEINDALNQAQIKNAVGEEPAQEEYSPEQAPQQEEFAPQTQEMPQEGYEQAPAQEQFAQQPQQEQYSEQPQEGAYPEQQGQQYYEDQAGYPNQATTSDVTIEIAEQVFVEKIKELQKQVELNNEFRTLAQTKIDHNAERLKKIESTMDKLQIAILNKIGSYGDNLGSIKKEMSMMQDSFSKLANKPIKAPAKHKAVHKKTSKKK